MNVNDALIEIGFSMLNKHGQTVCGDTFLSRKMPGENRYVAVLSDGLGSGIKANVLSTMTASMALKFVTMRQPVLMAARSIMDTLPVDSQRNISYSTFSIAEIGFDGETMVVEYGNPSFAIISNGKAHIPPKEKFELGEACYNRKIYLSKFILNKDERLVLFSDGVSQSGIGIASMPFGWGNDGAVQSMLDVLKQNPNLSANDLAKYVVKKADQNDLGKPQDDTTCAVIYRREPRMMLLVSGPPYSEDKDAYLAAKLEAYPGKTIICGGTTAKIIARQLNREICVQDIDKLDSKLPPVSHIDGVDLVTEGILTLGRVSELLKNSPSLDISDRSAAGRIVKHFLNADIIDFLVGTKINIAHQDPNLPVELEIRRNVLKRIARLLEEKFLKEVRMQFI
jgi:hypothetical protein